MRKPRRAALRQCGSSANFSTHPCRRSSVRTHCRLATGQLQACSYANAHLFGGLHGVVSTTPALPAWYSQGRRVPCCIFDSVLWLSCTVRLKLSERQSHSPCGGTWHSCSTCSGRRPLRHVLRGRQPTALQPSWNLHRGHYLSFNSRARAVRRPPWRAAAMLVATSRRCGRQFSPPLGHDTTAAGAGGWPAPRSSSQPCVKQCMPIGGLCGVLHATGRRPQPVIWWWLQIPLFRRPHSRAQAR